MYEEKGCIILICVYVLGKECEFRNALISLYGGFGVASQRIGSITRSESVLHVYRMNARRTTHKMVLSARRGFPNVIDPLPPVAQTRIKATTCIKSIYGMRWRGKHRTYG